MKGLNDRVLLLDVIKGCIDQDGCTGEAVVVQEAKLKAKQKSAPGKSVL